jgi:hypothetical protein
VSGDHSDGDIRRLVILELGDHLSQADRDEWLLAATPYRERVQRSCGNEPSALISRMR